MNKTTPHDAPVHDDSPPPAGHKANMQQALDQIINRAGDYIRRHEGIHGNEWSPEAQHLMAGLRECIEIERKSRSERES